MTHHEAELLGKRKVTRKLFEDLLTAPPPSGRPAAVRLKPGRCVVGRGAPLPAHRPALAGSWLVVCRGVWVASPLPPAERDPGPAASRADPGPPAWSSTRELGLQPVERKAHHLIWLSASPGSCPDVLGSWDKQPGCSGRRRGSFHHLEEALGFGRALRGEVVRGGAVRPPLTWCGCGGSRRSWRAGGQCGGAGLGPRGLAEAPPLTAASRASGDVMQVPRDWEEQCV